MQRKLILGPEMPRVLITGGSGGLGTELVPRLLAQGYTVRILSRGTRPAGADPAVEWAQASLETGEGLAEAVKGADIILHAASTPSAVEQVDTGGAARLLELTRGTQTHFFYISIVGVDRHPRPYYRAKYATEELVEQSAVPWTILRATQFHTLLGRVLLPGIDRQPIFLLPTNFYFQPIETGEVAQRIVELLQQGPRGRAADIGGPEILPVVELARSWLRAQGRMRRILQVPLFGKEAAAFRQGVNTTPAHKDGRITWQQWLDKEYPAK